MSSLDRLLTTNPAPMPGGWPLAHVRWSTAGIRTKILTPLIFLMTLSLLGSTIGFIISTNTTRNRILDGQLHEEASRLTSALVQGETNIYNGALLLSDDPDMVRALQDDSPGSEAIMLMDQRAVPVLERFRLDQVLVRNASGTTRVNITTYADISEIPYHDHAKLSTCHTRAQTNLIETEGTTLLVGCAPVHARATESGQEDTLTGIVYTAMHIPRTLERLRRELGLSAEIQLLNQTMADIEAALAEHEHPPSHGISIDGYRVRDLPITLADQDVDIVLQHSEQEINEIVGSGLRVMLISSGLTLLLLLSIGVWLARSFTRPILKLDRVAQAVAAGDLSQRANLSHRDEIGRLGQSFDHATTTITELLDQQARTAGERHAILQSMADGLLAIDRQEHIIMVNPVAASLLGQQPTDLLFKPLVSLTNVEDPVLAAGLEHVVEQVRSELVDPDMEKTEGCITLRNRVVRLHSAPTLAGDSITGAVVVIQDITQAVEADRTKNAFIGTASHEMRTPLASMKGFVDIFYLGGIDNLTESQRMFLDTIRRQTDNMVNLVNDLLEMARLEQGTLRGEQQWVSIQNAIHETLETLKPQLEHKSIELHRDIDPHLPHIWIDTLHLRRILTNLISNAIKYSYPGGFIALRARVLHNPETLPRLSENPPWKAKEPRSVIFEVEDRGVGIRESDQPKIFDRFFRSDNDLSVEAGGTGLGLAITRSLVHLHEGQIGFRSVEAEGSCFWVRLPAPNTELLNHKQEPEADMAHYDEQLA